MTVSSGFFNSVNHDRLYDAEQLSSIFDGVIEDGVYQAIGEAFKVSVVEDAENVVTVGTGRAWFDHTWTVNDSTYAITLDPPNEALGRIDAIVLDVDRTQSVRKNSIEYVRGVYSESPAKPVLVKSDLHNQYPLAYITMPKGSGTVITNSNIEIMVGTSECPLVIGVLESFNGDLFIQQIDAEFNEWWDGIKDALDENTVTKLQNQINDLKNSVEVIESKQIDVNAPKNIRLHYMLGTDFPTLFNNANTVNRAFILPDGYLLLFAYSDLDKFPDAAGSDGADNDTFICALMNLDGVVSNQTLVENGKHSSKYYTRMACLIDEQVDSYPASVTYLMYGNMARTKYTFDKVTITVTESHVLNVSKNSTPVTLSGVPSSYDPTWANICSIPAFLPGGNRIAFAWSSAGSKSPGYFISFFIDNDGVISVKTNQVSEDYIYGSGSASYYMVIGYYNKTSGTVVFPATSDRAYNAVFNADGTFKELTTTNTVTNGIGTLSFDNINWFNTDYAPCSGNYRYKQSADDPTKIIGELFNYVAISGTTGNAPNVTLPAEPENEPEGSLENYTSSLNNVSPITIPDSQSIASIISDPGNSFILATSTPITTGSSSTCGIKVLTSLSGGIWSSYGAYKDSGFASGTHGLRDYNYISSLLLQKKCIWKSSDGQKIIVVIPGYVSTLNRKKTEQYTHEICNSWVFYESTLSPEVWLIEK